MGAKTHRLSNHPLYHCLAGMIQRCTNKKNAAYKYYGGRGILLCAEWRNNFEAFYLWAIDNGWEKGLTIDRINNDGNYEPGNCRWVTLKENMNNMRRPGRSPMRLRNLANGIES